MRANTVQLEKVVSNICPQGSCFGKGVWNMQYNSLFNFELRKKIKAIALADELLITVKTETVGEA